MLVDIDNPQNSSIAVAGDVPGTIFGLVAYAGPGCTNLNVYALTDIGGVYLVDFDCQELRHHCDLGLTVLRRGEHL